MWSSCREWMCVVSSLMEVEWRQWTLFFSLSLDKRQFCVSLCPNECGRGKNVLCNRVSLNWNSFNMSLRMKSTQLNYPKQTVLFVYYCSFTRIWQNLTKNRNRGLHWMEQQNISNTVLVNCAYVTKNTNVIKKKLLKWWKNLKEIKVSYSISKFTPPLHN